MWFTALSLELYSIMICKFLKKYKNKTIDDVAINVLQQGFLSEIFRDF
jgi:hypothetical protein